MTKNTDINTEEKIDYIYMRMKKQEKIEFFSTCLKWGSKIIILMYLYYFIFYTIPGIKQDIIDGLTPNMNIPEMNIDTLKKSDLLENIINKFSNSNTAENEGDSSDDLIQDQEDSSYNY